MPIQRRDLRVDPFDLLRVRDVMTSIPVGGGAAALAMPWLLGGYDPEVVAGAQGLVLLMPFMLCNTLVYSVYEALGRFRWINIVMLGQTLATLVLLAVLGWMGELTAVRSAYCYALPPLVLALVLGDMAESSFRQAMLLSQGDLAIFWSNPLVGTIVTLALTMLFWPVISLGINRFRGSPAAPVSVK